MTITGKVFTSSLALLLFLFAALLYNWFQVAELAGSQKHLGKIFEASQEVASLKTALGNISDLALGYSVSRDERYLKTIEDRWEENDNRLSHIERLRLEGVDQDEVRALREFFEEVGGVGEDGQRVGFEALFGGSEDSKEAIKQSVAYWTAENNSLASKAGSVSAKLKTSFDDQTREAGRVPERVVQLSGLAFFTAMAFSLIVVLLTVRSIHRSVRRLVRAAEAIGKGHFELLREPRRRRDEFTRVSVAFNDMVRRLGEVDLMKREFLTHVSHELKTPLATLQETNTLLLDEIPGPLNDKQRRLLSLNLQSGRRLSAMISHLLDLSRIEAGGLDLDRKTLDLGELVASAADRFEGRGRERGVRIDVSLPEGQILASCDRDRLLQVLDNLVDNGLRFSPAGTRLDIRLQSLDEAPSDLPERWRTKLGDGKIKSSGIRLARIVVADHGPGIPEEEHERIFEKFHQVPRTGNRSGVGLGLAICREIVAAHDGAIWVESRPGGGSQFTILLPTRSATDAETGPIERTETFERLEPIRRKERIGGTERPERPANPAGAYMLRRPPLTAVAFALALSLGLGGCSSNLLSRGDEAFASGDYQSAQQAYTAYLQRPKPGSKDDYALFRQGLTHALGASPNQDFVAARLSFGELLKTYPESPYAPVANLVLDGIEKTEQLQTALLARAERIERLKERGVEIQERMLQLRDEAETKEAQIRELESRLGDLEGQLQRSTVESSRKEELLRQLRAELEGLKRIDVEARPPR